MNYVFEIRAIFNKEPYYICKTFADFDTAKAHLLKYKWKTYVRQDFPVTYQIVFIDLRNSSKDQVLFEAKYKLTKEANSDNTIIEEETFMINKLNELWVTKAARL